MLGQTHQDRQGEPRVEVLDTNRAGGLQGDAVGTDIKRTKAQVDWSKEIGFGLHKTNSFVRYVWRNGVWSQGNLVRGEPNVTLNVASTALNYGQTCFEGLKAFRMTDGKVRIFRPEVNHARLQHSCIVAGMPFPPLNIFLEACRAVVQDNINFVPPLDTGAGALYIRPLVFGSGPQLQLIPAEEYQFVVYVNPVGSYHSDSTPSTKAIILADLDRAAPNGSGHAKLGGNYVNGLLPTIWAQSHGYGLTLFLDAKEQKYVDEFAVSNFIGIQRSSGNIFVYVTPDSTSILNSVTNRSLMEIAERKLGWKVEKRAVLWDEVKSGAFSEVAACGTAVVLTLVGQIDRQIVKHGEIGDQLHWVLTGIKNDPRDIEMESVTLTGDGSGTKMLLDALRKIQTGEDTEDWGWMWPREGL